MVNTENKRRNIKDILVNYNTYLIFILLIILSSFLSDYFFTTNNITNLFLQQAAPILVAIGMLFVILTGGIDLSVGSIMALGSSVSAILITQLDINYTLAIFLTIIVGTLFGLFTGILVAYVGIQGFVASLAMMTIAKGASFLLTNGMPVKIESGTLSVLASKSNFYPILIITFVLIILFVLIQRLTGWGRIIIAIGSNPTAVELAGIKTKKFIASAYALSGSLAALAGVFVAARSSTGSATVGQMAELDAIAACVIGGASLMGGKGFVFRAVIGVLVLGLISNVMNLMSIPSYPQDIIKGFIIIAAVALQIITGKQEKTV